MEELVGGLWAELLGVEAGRPARRFLRPRRPLSSPRHPAVGPPGGGDGVELPLRALFAHPTVEGLAAEVVRLLRAPAALSLPLIEPVVAGNEAPASLAQERLWFFQQLDPAGSVLNVPQRPAPARRAPAGRARHRPRRDRPPSRHAAHHLRLRRQGSPAADRVSRAGSSPPRGSRRSARRAPRRGGRAGDCGGGGGSLRPRGGGRSGVPDCCAWKSKSTGCSSPSITASSTAGRSMSSTTSWRPSTRRPFEGASRRCPSRPSSTRTSPSGSAAGSPTRRWRRSSRTGAGSSPGCLWRSTSRPTFRGPARQSFRGATRDLPLSPTLPPGVKELGRRRAPHFSSRLSPPSPPSWAATPAGSTWFSARRPPTVTGRGTEGLFGFFVDTMVLRLDLGGDPTFRELLRRAREVALGAMAHPDLSFERLVEELDPARDKSRSPLIQVMLLVQTLAAKPLQFAGLAARGGRGPLQGPSQFDFTPPPSTVPGASPWRPSTARPCSPERPSNGCSRTSPCCSRRWWPTPGCDSPSCRRDRPPPRQVAEAVPQQAQEETVETAENDPRPPPGPSSPSAARASPAPRRICSKAAYRRKG